MSDLWHRMCSWIDQNRWLFVALVVFGVLASLGIATVGCASKTTIMGQTVDRPGLEQVVATEEAKLKIEQTKLQGDLAAWNEKVELLNATTNSALADLEAQDLQRAKIVEAINTVATGAAAGTLTPTAAIPAGIGLLGILFGLGTAADNRRKDGVITDLKKTPAS